jgi:glucose-1-phosphate thymidylyltransferase
MKGIILAGGSGTRLYPITKGTSKQLLSIYDKPMVYYPLSVLMLSGIKEILIISTPKDLPNFRNLLGSGAELGLSFEYKEQPSPDGLAQAFILGEKFIGKDDVCLVLGDNIFYGRGFSKLLHKSVELTGKEKKATVFGYFVNDPENFGVVELDKNNKVISIVEKPNAPKSNYAVVGLYYYPNNVIQISKSIKPSSRGELEISSVNEEYLKKGILNVEILDKDFAWLDTGTHDSLLQASNYIHNIENQYGLKVACLEEIAYKMGYIDSSQLKILIEPLKKTGYGKYLKNKVL